MAPYSTRSLIEVDHLTLEEYAVQVCRFSVFMTMEQLIDNESVIDVHFWQHGE
jgi:hypothetical protein